MRPRTRALAVVTLFFALGAFLQGEPPEAARIAALVKQLGDEDFDIREKAQRDLEKAGEAALPALRKAEALPDLEVRRRAVEVVRAIILAHRKSASTGLETALVDPGKFQMGSSPNESWRKPEEAAHPVRITRPFLLGVHEVTQGEYEKVMQRNPAWFAAKGGGGDKVAGQDTARFPVENVTWFDAVEFCNALSKLDGYAPYYKIANEKRENGSLRAAGVAVVRGTGYRLPTEAEWEYACRAGTTTPYHFNGSNTGHEANLRPGPATGYGGGPMWPAVGRTTKVRSFPPNGLGLYDMHGNAGEWCQDWYDRDYYANSPGDDPEGPATGTQRVLRGGSWVLSETGCRSASRLGLAPDSNNNYAGFRVARTP
jgi:formylglycine-generating enzyme required for sulfatase activity